MKHLTTLYQKAREHFSRNAQQAKRMATDPLGPIPEGANATDLAAWTVVANVLLNLDELFMKR